MYFKSCTVAWWWLYVYRLYVYVKDVHFYFCCVEHCLPSYKLHFATVTIVGIVVVVGSYVNIIVHCTAYAQSRIYRDIPTYTCISYDYNQKTLSRLLSLLIWMCKKILCSLCILSYKVVRLLLRHIRTKKNHYNMPCSMLAKAYILTARLMEILKCRVWNELGTFILSSVSYIKYLPIPKTMYIYMISDAHFCQYVQ